MDDVLERSLGQQVATLRWSRRGSEERSRRRRDSGKARYVVIGFAGWKGTLVRVTVLLVCRNGGAQAKTTACGDANTSPPTQLRIEGNVHSAAGATSRATCQMDARGLLLFRRLHVIAVSWYNFVLSLRLRHTATLTKCVLSHRSLKFLLQVSW